MRFTLLFCFILFFTATCDYGANNDSGEEISCKNATGTWIISSANCNGSSPDPVVFSTITFEDGNFSKLVRGTSDCQSKFENIIHHVGEGINLYGQGNFSCASNGSVANSCSGAQASCDSSILAANRNQTYPSCVIADGVKLRLSRTVSSDEITGNLSMCSTAGDVEILEFTPAVPGPALLHFPGGSSVEFETLLPGQASTPVPITIINVGTQDATSLDPPALSSPFYYAGGSYPGTGGNCSTTLPATSACQIVIGFEPPSVANYNQTIYFNFQNGSGSSSVPFYLAGIGDQPIAELELDRGDPIDFGNVTAATQASVLLTFSNVGTGPAVSFNMSGLVPPFYYAGGTFPGTNGTCGNIINAGTSCVVELQFQPAGPGVFSTNINYTFYDGTATLMSPLTLKGAGITAGP